MTSHQKRTTSPPIAESLSRGSTIGLQHLSAKDTEPVAIVGPMDTNGSVETTGDLADTRREERLKKRRERERAYRARKRNHLMDLESRVANLERDKVLLTDVIISLQSQLEDLQKKYQDKQEEVNALHALFARN